MAKHASMLPENAEQGGAVPDKVNLLVVDAKVCLWDYGSNGAIPQTTAVALTFRDDAGETFQRPQYYSVGKPEMYWPSDDGMFIESEKDGLSASCNYMLLLKSAKRAGFDMPKLDSEGVKAWMGTYAFWVAEKPATRKGLAAAGETRDEKPVAVIDKLLDTKTAPKGSKPPAAKAGPPARPTAPAVPGRPAAPKAPAVKAPTPPAKPEPTVEPYAACLELVKEAIAANGGEPVAKETVSQAMMDKYGRSKQRDNIAEVLFSEQFVEWAKDQGVTADEENFLTA